MGSDSMGRDSTTAFVLGGGGRLGAAEVGMLESFAQQIATSGLDDHLQQTKAA